MPRLSAQLGDFGEKFCITEEVILLCNEMQRLKGKMLPFIVFILKKTKHALFFVYLRILIQRIRIELITSVKKRVKYFFGAKKHSDQQFHLLYLLRERRGQ